MILDELGQALHFVPFLSTEMGTDTEFRVSRAKCSPPAVGGASFPTACANLAGANLLGASVTEAQLSQAKSLQGTIMPDGTERV